MSSRFPLIPLSDAVEPVRRAESPIPGRVYRQIGVHLWGAGAYEREKIDGGHTQYGTLFRIETNDIIVNKIWARNGSVAVVSADLSGCYGSSEFPTFAPIHEKLEPRWFHWITKTEHFWQQCNEKSHGTSGKNRIKPEQFLEIEIPLPLPNEQRRIVARIEAYAAAIEEARELRRAVENELEALLRSLFSKLIVDAPYRPMSEVAPIMRRWVDVDASQDYYELGIRSFAKGTFHKPALSGLEIGTKRILWIEAGDLVFMNVFAWEGAIAVAQQEDQGRVGSHRYITCVPQKGVATAPFLCFYFSTPEGLAKIGEASPGGAGRNRTLGIEKLERIEVPIPDYDKQVWFDELQSRVDSVKRLQAETAAELDALLPSILDQAFRGDL